MTRDEVVFGLLVVAFASFATAHVALCLALAGRAPRLRAIFAFVAFPLAPVWGARDGLYRRVALWLTCALAYGVLRVVARH
jgi:hypothetical protein